MDIYNLYFDGSCGPKNPGGTAAYGFALYKNGVEEPIEHGSGVIGTGPGMTNNLAEFFAVGQGLAAFTKHRPEGQVILNVYGDSNLVVQVLNKKWSPKSNSAYYPAYVIAKEWLGKVRTKNTWVNIDWIPREQNTFCDDLSKEHNATS